VAKQIRLGFDGGGYVERAIYLDVPRSGWEQYRLELDKAAAQAQAQRRRATAA
jgi:hypothetical protein